MANAEKEVMRAAFARKLAQSKLHLDFTSVQSNEEFDSIKASIGGVAGTVSGAERKERAVALFGESSKPKAYKLAKKYQLVDVGGVAHVLTRVRDDTPVPGVEGAGVFVAQPPTADGLKRLVPEGELFCQMSRCEDLPIPHSLSV